MNKKVIGRIILIIFTISMLWLGLLFSECYRVSKNKRPFICIANKEDIESSSMYSNTCYGVFYKHREYYSSKDNLLVAREITLVYKDFKGRK